MTAELPLAGRSRIDEARLKPGPGDALASIIRAKITFIVPMLVVSLSSYLALTVLAGFSKEVLSSKLAGPLNVGFFLIFCDYFLILALAVLYTRIARSIFDPLADQILSGEQP